MATNRRAKDASTLEGRETFTEWSDISILQVNRSRGTRATLDAYRHVEHWTGSGP
jgi:hypothetical protein